MGLRSGSFENTDRAFAGAVVSSEWPELDDDDPVMIRLASEGFSWAVAVARPMRRWHPCATAYEHQLSLGEMVGVILADQVLL
jgi:hypothetical protein